MALAASGQPDKCLTLTVAEAAGADPAARYRALHLAWKNLVKRILRQFALPPEKRWVVKSPEGYEYQEIRSYKYTKETKATEYNKVHYMSFAEETKRGEPHLHILLRSPYIPQLWISQQMNEMIKSPIVWIEQIKNTKQAIGYVSKYVSKAPAQFGKSRRYWISRGYEVNKGDRDIKPVVFRKSIRVVRQRYEEFAEYVVTKGLLPYPMADGWIRLYTVEAAQAEWGRQDTERIIPQYFAASVEYAKLCQAIGVKYGG